MPNFLIFPKMDDDHNFPSEVREAMANSPEIDLVVRAKAAEALADDPSVLSAAVALAQSDAGLLKSQVIAAGTDLDTVLTVNAYTTAGGGASWAALHFPASIAGQLFVSDLSPTVKLQTIITDAPNARLFARRRANNIWSGWSEVGKPALPVTTLAGGVSLDTLAHDTVAESAGGGVTWAEIGYPANVAGVIITYGINGTTQHATQVLISWEDVPRQWTRRKQSNVWKPWDETTAPKLPIIYGAADANTMVRGNIYSHSAAFTNGPVGMAAGYITTISIQDNSTYLSQVATEWSYPGTVAREWTRRKDQAGWSEWLYTGPLDGSSFTKPVSERPGSGMKIVRIPITAGHNPSVATAMSSGTTEQLIHWNFPIFRWRYSIRNIDLRSGVTRPEGADFTGLALGPADGVLTPKLGAFVLPDGGVEYNSPWINGGFGEQNVAQILKTDYTLHAGSNSAPWEQYGHGWQTPSGGGARSLKNTMPFTVAIDVETYATTPIFASITDSMGVGVGAARGMHESWLNVLCRQLQAIPIHMGSSGDTILGSSDPNAYKWTRFYNFARPDAVAYCMAINDFGNGANYATVKARFDSVISLVKERVSPNVFLTTITPKDSDVSASAFEINRKLYNTYLKTLPHESRDIFDLSAAISNDDETIRPEFNFDGLHVNTLGHAAMAQAMNVVGRPITSPPVQYLSI